MDLEQQQKMQSDTLFRIMSITKFFTAIAIMMLYEEGYFQLYDPVSMFIPEFSDLKVFNGNDQPSSKLDREITILDLLTHTSGLAYGIFTDSPVENMYQDVQIFDHQSTLEQLIKKLITLPLVHQLGQIWRYSAGFDVLARLVEICSNQSYNQFLKNRILQPLKMNDTGYRVLNNNKGRFAKIYTYAESGNLIPFIQEVTHSVFSHVYDESVSLYPGGHGLVSTIFDIQKITQLLLNKGELNDNRLLSRKTVEFMWQNHLSQPLLPYGFPAVPDFFNGYGFGLGFPVLLDSTKARIIGSKGEILWGGGLNTDYWIDPIEDIVLIVMAQLTPRLFRLGHDFKVMTYQALS